MLLINSNLRVSGAFLWISALKLPTFIIAKANELIKTMNRKIVKINSELKDANQIKDNYVSLYMKLSTQYIRLVDEERSHLSKILRSPKFADEEYKRFRN